MSKVIKEYINGYDLSTINDLPDMARHMVTSEYMHMWTYPEPEVVDGVYGRMTMASWWIVTSVTDAFMLNIGTDFCMGGDEYGYEEVEVRS